MSKQQNHSAPYEEALKRTDYKVRFGVSNVKFKVFCLAKSYDDLHPVDAAKELLKGMETDRPTGAVEPPT